MSLAGLLMAGGGMGALDAGQQGQQMMKKPPGMGERLMGLLGDPRMHVALSLLESGGYQQQPVSLGQAMARAGVAGANAIQMQQRLDLDREKAKADADAKVARAKRDNAQAGLYEAQTPTAGQWTGRPGDVRFDRNNNPVASVARAPERVIIQDGVVFHPITGAKIADHSKDKLIEVDGRFFDPYTGGLITDHSKDKLIEVDGRFFDPYTGGLITDHSRPFIISAGRVFGRDGNLIADHSTESRSNVPVTIVTSGGRSISAQGMRTGDDFSVLDKDGEYKPLAELYPDAVRVEAGVARQQQVKNDGEPWTRGDFVGRRDIPAVDYRAAAGPYDGIIRGLSRIPGLGPLAKEIGGAEWGDSQRVTDMVFNELENQIIQAFRPGEGRGSDLQIKLAQKLVPNRGAFATDESARVDLQTLGQLSEQRVERALEIANDPRRPEKQREEALLDLEANGYVIDLTNALLRIGNDPMSRAMLSGEIDDAFVERFSGMNEAEAEGLLKALTDAQFDELERRMQRQSQ